MNVHNQDPIEQKISELIAQMTLSEKVSLLSGKDAWRTMPIPRLGIPSITMTDGPHGVRASYPDAGRKAGPTTCFPTGVSMAATWNTELIEKVGMALAEETRAMDCDILLGPCVNIVRHPLAGRNFESYSEDPYLNGKIGVAYVKGLQSKKVGASLKHFAANNQEFERHRGSSEIDERTFREIYLPHFEMVVKEAKPFTVMCSYNRINGVYASQNRHLLREILKEEWGFDGVVVSDWGANHTIFESVENGLDLEMPGPARYYGKLLEDAVHHWQIDENIIDDAVRRILRVLFWVGKFDDPATLPPGSVNTPEHQALAREVAEEAITLLKNEGELLPLDPDKIQSIAIIGPNAAEDRIGGGGSSYVDPPYRVSPLEAIRARFGDRMRIEYEKGCDNYHQPPVLGADWLGEEGLKIDFFDNPTLEGHPADTIVVPKAEMWMWANSLPAPHVTSPRFSFRATGKFTPSESGTFTLYLYNTSTCRVFINGEKVFDQVSKPREHRAEGEAQCQMDLEAGKSYDLVIEYLKDNEDNFAFWKLAWMRFFAPGEDHRLQKAIELAARSDVALVFVGMPEGFESEGYDRPHMRLPGAQDELVQAVLKANPNTVVILNAGSPVEMPWADEVPAILEAYYPGQEGGNAVAKILFGEINPSGKLTVTFPHRLEDTPAFINYPGDRKVYYGEGIFVGYRYYDKKKMDPLFPFGHGLSYTTFAYENLTVPSEAAKGQTVQVQVTVRNTGKRAGKEVVQIYVSDLQSSLPRPPKELKGFAKVELQPGEAKTVSFELDERAFAYYDPYQHRWVVEPGEFQIHAGSSSRDIRATAVIRLV